MGLHKKKVLFLCTQNSARSQIAEALLRDLYGNRYEVYSAGTDPSQVNPYAIKILQETGIDTSCLRSKSIDEYGGEQFDYVITLCDQAKEQCSCFPGGKTHLHKGFDDPANIGGTENEKVAVFRKIRAEIKDWIKEMFGQKDA